MSFRNPQLKRRGVPAAALLLIIAALLWMLRENEPTKAPSRTVTPTPNANTGTIPNTPTATTTPTTKLSAEQRVALVDGLIDSTNQPINFWGKVIDQDGQPVSGVTVRYSYHTEHGNAVGSPWGASKGHNGTTTTQADGIFTITGLRGHWLSILGLEKPGFKRANQIAREEISFNYDRAEPTHFTPDKNNPVIFPMVQEAALEPLIAHGVPDDLLYDLPADGTPVFWDPWHGKRAPAGEFKLTFKREPVTLAPGQKPARWQATLEIVGGGLIHASSGSLLFTAPDDEYSTVVDYPEDDGIQGMHPRRFYFRTAKGNYGRLEIELTPNDEGSSARARLAVYLNPKPGSRNLEYDKTKRQRATASNP